MIVKRLNNNNNIRLYTVLIFVKLLSMRVSDIITLHLNYNSVLTINFSSIVFWFDSICYKIYLDSFFFNKT